MRPARTFHVAQLGNHRVPGEQRPYDTAKWRNELRDEILKRDGHKCQIGLDGCTGKAEHVDHIRPDRPLQPANLRAACPQCNGKRAAIAQHR